MSSRNRDLISKSLDLLLAGLVPFVEREFTAHYKGRSQQVLKQLLGARISNWQQPFGNLDAHALLSVMDRCWNEVFRDTLGRSERSFVNELRDVRNSWAHQEQFSDDDTYRALDSCQRLLMAVSAEQQAQKVLAAKSEVLRELSVNEPDAWGQESETTGEDFQILQTTDEDRKSTRGMAGKHDKSVIVVIVCAASKRDYAGSMRLANGKEVRFIANPGLVPKEGRSDDCVYMHPDDLSETGVSWKDRLLEYNLEYQRSGQNPLGLLPAFELYRKSIYRELVSHLGIGKVYILSGGWGLISASFLTPQYDITFSSQAEKWKRRGKRDSYQDFCQLPEGYGGTIEFFGGKEYTGFFAKLTQAFDCRKVVRYNSETLPTAPGCELKRYTTRAKTTWYYQAARRLIEGSIDERLDPEL